MVARCPICGWAGAQGRNGRGLCIDQALCAHRFALEQRGRPRASACRCVVWPCPCTCHSWPRVTELPHDPSFDAPGDDEPPPTKPEGR